MLPCMSMARVLPSGEMATDIEVPSLTVTSINAAGLLTVAAFDAVCAKAMEANGVEPRKPTCDT